MNKHTFYEISAKEIEGKMYTASQILLYSNWGLYYEIEDKNLIENCCANNFLDIWSELSQIAKEHIINQAIMFGYEFGYNTKLNSTYTDNDLEVIDRFWQQAHHYSSEDLKYFIACIDKIESLQKHI